MTKNFDGGLEGLYSEGFPLMLQFQFQFDMLLEEHLPRLKHHFDSMAFPPALWISKWFMTLFLYSFPLGLCIRIWDNILVKGITFLFKVRLAVLRILENDIMQSDFEEINELFNSLINGCGEGHRLPNAEEIIRLADAVTLSEEKLA